MSGLLCGRSCESVVCGSFPTKTTAYWIIRTSMKNQQILCYVVKGPSVLRICHPCWLADSLLITVISRNFWCFGRLSLFHPLSHATQKLTLPVFYMQVFVNIRADSCSGLRHKIVVSSHLTDVFSFAESFNSNVDLCFLLLAGCVRRNAWMHAGGCIFTAVHRFYDIYLIKNALA